jgi:hypothetical protein
MTPNKKLGQTLQDLEAAFADWQSLSDSPAFALHPSNGASVTAKNKETNMSMNPASLALAAAAAKDLQLRKKTKKLLDQLRVQLAALED